MTNPEGIIGAIVSLIILFLLFDFFFCGCFLIDEAILKMVAEATASLVTLAIVPLARDQEADDG